MNKKSILDEDRKIKKYQGYAIGCFFIISSLLFNATVALGQGQQTLESTMQEIAKDLATLQQEVEHASRTETGPSWETTFPASAKVYDDGRFIPVAYRLRTTAKLAFIREGADDKALVLEKAPRGTSFDVIDKTGPWYAVALDKPINGLSSGWIKATYAAPELKLILRRKEDNETKQKSVSERLSDVYEKMTESLKTLQDKYKNNPFVKVTGFTVNLAIPPTLSVSFQFK
ncbi:MAG: SH3 domain-containing protein [Syntrophales bacterium]|jgi:hypothetical protein